MAKSVRLAEFRFKKTNISSLIGEVLEILQINLSQGIVMIDRLESQIIAFEKVGFQVLSRRLNF